MRPYMVNLEGRKQISEEMATKLTSKASAGPSPAKPLAKEEESGCKYKQSSKEKMQSQGLH